MIINALYQYYQRLVDDPDSGISRPGYSKAKVAFALILSKAGELIEVVDLRVTKGNRLVPRELDVPEQIKRTSGVVPNFLCDNCTYVLGINQKNKSDKKGRIKEAFESFTSLHAKILGNLADEGVVALLDFLVRWDINKAEAHAKILPVLEQIKEGGNLVFKLDGIEGYIHERPAIVNAWESMRSSQETDITGQCLVTGLESPIARLHPSIKGVAGAQSSGASLVSFNLEAFTSYGKSQSYNAPVSTEVTFGYTTALNYLISHPKQQMRLGDTTMVFWAERASIGIEEDLLGALFNPTSDRENIEGNDGQIVRDPRTTQLLHDIYGRIRSGRPVNVDLTEVDLHARFYVLGLAPNASRLSVRFWHMDEFGGFLEKVSQHYRDLALIKNFDSEPDFIPPGIILKETAPLGEAKRIPPLLGGILIRSILTGMPYPQGLYSAILSRIRADQKVNYVRVSMLKACLVRNNRFYKKEGEVGINVTLNQDETNSAYLLGRLFALLEKAQQDANPGLNSTIRDRYFGSASATPGSVFPILLRLSQHHISKSDYGFAMDKRIEEVITKINSFPAHLNLEEQGLFIIGYYHQRQALFQKTEMKEGEQQ